MNQLFKNLGYAGLMASAAMLAPAAANAQLPAALPDKESVAPGEATDVDGTYVVSTINKRITIENGRAYVVDPWTQALIFRVNPGMVTLQNFRKTGPDRYEADDLPMQGKVVFHRQPNGALQGVVNGAFGEHKYVLVPTALATVPGDGAGDGSGGVPPVVEQPRIYRLHVSGSRCSGTDTFRKNYRGTLKVSIVDPSGNRMTSKHRNFAVACTKKGERSQNYSFYGSGPGALTITVPPGSQPFRDMRVLVDNKKGKNFNVNRAHSSRLTNDIKAASSLAVGQPRNDRVEVYG